MGRLLTRAMSGMGRDQNNWRLSINTFQDKPVVFIQSEEFDLMNDTKNWKWWQTKATISFDGDSFVIESGGKQVRYSSAEVINKKIEERTGAGLSLWDDALEYLGAKK